MLNRSYTITLDSIWSPVAKYLAALPERYDQDEAYDRYRTAREASVDALIRLAPTVQVAAHSATDAQAADVRRRRILDTPLPRVASAPARPARASA